MAQWVEVGGVSAAVAETAIMGAGAAAAAKNFWNKFINADDV